MSSNRSVLYVEGKNDQMAIGSLLQLHGIDTDYQTRQFDIKPAKKDGDVTTESIEVLLTSIPESVRRSAGKPVGFVLDADSEIKDRWKAVCSRLEKLGVVCPPEPQAGGFVSDVPDYKTRVGVWLMPNNTDTGMLENFLQDLIAEGDVLLPIAQKATDEVMAINLRFPEVHKPKAIIHAWLAWQAKPGLPFGSALTARFFRHEKASAQAFVTWFRNLFFGGRPG